MKILFLSTLFFFFLSACQKESVKKDIDFKSIIGVWESEPNNQEKIKITISKSGKINIENSTERSITFKVAEILKKQYIDTKNGDTLDNFKFKGTKMFSEVNSRNLIVNKARDTMYYDIKKINNFYADSSFLSLLIRTK